MSKINWQHGMVLRAELKTGYFGNSTRFTKVHFITADNKPLCGCKINKDLEYQWCSNLPMIGYVECGNCLSIYKKQEEKELGKMQKAKYHKEFEL